MLFNLPQVAVSFDAYRAPAHLEMISFYLLFFLGFFVFFLPFFFPFFLLFSTACGVSVPSAGTVKIYAQKCLQTPAK